MTTATESTATESTATESTAESAAARRNARDRARRAARRAVADRELAVVDDIASAMRADGIDDRAIYDACRYGAIVLQSREYGPCIVTAGQPQDPVRVVYVGCDGEIYYGPTQYQSADFRCCTASAARGVTGSRASEAATPAAIVRALRRAGVEARR